MDRAPRRIARRLRLAGRVEHWVSLRAPFVWRTRMLLWATGGVVATLLAATFGRQLGTEPQQVPGLDQVHSWLFYASSLWYGLILIVVVDVVRRTRPIVRGRHHVLVFICVSTSILTLSLPQTAFVRTLAPRVATLESEATIAEHARYRFWRCWPGIPSLETAIAPRRTLLESASRRYLGVNAADFASSPDDATECLSYVAGDDRFSPAADDSRVVVEFYGVSAPLAHKLRHVDAAQRYRRGDTSGYGSITLLAAVLVSMLAGAAATLGSSSYVPDVERLTRGWLGRSRRWRARRSRLDLALAKRSPVLWSSRTHAALAYLALPPVLFSAASVDSLPAADVWLLLTLGVIALCVALQTQRAARLLPLNWRGDVGVFMAHAALVALAAVLALALNGSLAHSYPSSVIVVTLASFYMAAALQAARNGSTLVVLAAAVMIAMLLLGKLVVVFIWLGESTEGAWAAVALCTVSVSLLAAVSVRLEARPEFRRLALGAVLLMAPVPMTVFLALILPNDEDFTLAKWLLALLIGVGGVALALFATRNPRRALAYTAR